MKIRNDAVVMDRVDMDDDGELDAFDSALGLVFDEGENLESVIIQMRVICEVDVSDLDLGESMEVPFHTDELETIESKRSAFRKWLCRFVGIPIQEPVSQIIKHRLSRVLDGNKTYGRKLLKGFQGNQTQQTKTSKQTRMGFGGYL